jgi:hypothetical protein
MKLFLKTFLVVSVAAALPAFAGGTVNFGNDATALVQIGGGTAAAESHYVRAALYWAAAGSTNYVQLGAATTVGAPQPGVFAGGTRTTGKGTPGGAVGQFQVRCWSGGAATFEAAFAARAPVGQSAVLFVTTGNDGGAPPVPPGSLPASALGTIVLAVPPCVSADVGVSPNSVTVSPGATANFSVLANGFSPTRQWQTNHGSGWVDANGATSENFSLVATPNLNALQVRCRVSVACDNSTDNSAAATLTVIAPPVLAIGRSANEITLSWPVTAGDFNLQTMPQFSTAWANASPGLTTNGEFISATFPVTNAPQFFRLHHP